MSKSLRLGFLALAVVFFGSAFAGIKKDNHSPQKTEKKEYIYYEKGLRHHMVLMNEDGKLGKSAGVIDTIQHYFPTGVETWGTGILGGYAAPGDTVANWYWFAADTAEILEIHGSFATTGTGNWNVWDTVQSGAGFVSPNTAKSYLLVNAPWTITSADTTAEGVPTGNLQVLDLEAQGLNAEIPNDYAWVGYIIDANNGPHLFMDNGGHPRNGAEWWYARHFIGSFGGWYFWATSTTWTEFASRIVVFYKEVAPVATILTDIPNHFAGNPNYGAVEAEVVDLDGTVASATLHYQVNGGEVMSVAMTNDGGDIYSAAFGTTFAANDEVQYWVAATDDGGNGRESSGKIFTVVEPPAKGTSVLIVDDGSNLGAGLYEDALINIGTDYYLWDIAAAGGISGYEINWGFKNIVWTAFGASALPSPFETGAHPVKDYLDNGGNLLVVDNDYLFANGFGADTLEAGQFGYDYLGLHTGFSDPAYGDSVFYGHAGDMIGGPFAQPADSLAIFPDSWGVWSVAEGSYATDWQDLLVPNEAAMPVFYNSYYDEEANYNTAIKHNADGEFATAFFAFSVETASEEDFNAVLDSTLAWFASVNATSIEDTPGRLAESFKLHQNYPNPFNPTTNIEFYVATASKVKVEVFNSLGQKVTTLINKDLNRGTHDVQWNGKDFSNTPVSSGVYYYKITADNFTDIKKMVLLK